MTTLLDRRPIRTPGIDDDLTRRRLLSGTAGLGAGLLVGGCADDADPISAPTPSAAAEPVRIFHRHGTTEIPTEPARVVSVGVRDHDAVLALGVVPVGVRMWFSDQPFATWKWARNALGDGQPEVLARGELNFEAVAALRPDLIVGI